MNTKHGKGKPLWRNIIVILVTAAMFTAIYKSMDNITMHILIVADDSLTAAFAYLIIGGWVGVFSGIIFAFLLGKKLIDPDFNGFIIKNRKMHLQAFISGSISAGSTLFILWGNQLGDPSMVIALGSVTIIYIVLYDVFAKQITTKFILVPALMVLLGSVLSAFGGSLEVTLYGILFVLVISNGLSAFSEIVEQKGVRASDSVNLFIWRFFWLATTGTIIAIIFSWARGYGLMLMDVILKSLAFLPWIVGTMLFVFLGVGLKLYAKKNNAISLVLLVTSVQLVMAYPITIIGHLLHPGVFGDIPGNAWIWMIRMFGASLIILGIFIVTKRTPEQ